VKKLLAIVLMCLCISVKAQNALFIPDTLAGPNYNLTMHKDSVQFFPGNISHTYAFNSNSYLGPTLIFNKGTAVNISVSNQIGDTTTVHWHGLHVPSMWDGGPHSLIMASATWNPQFTIMNNAATYWYHPHLHMKTAEQAIKGAAGMIIVRDSMEATLSLPRKYGVDDFPVIVQCQQYDSLNQAMPKGMQDSTLLVNGTRANNGFYTYLNVPAQVVRLRLLNASGERAFNFGFTGNMLFYQIATDGGLLDAPHTTTRIRLAPGERAEILLNLTGMTGQYFNLMCYGSELPMGVQGGPTMPMSGGPPMDSPLNGVDYNIMQLNVIPQTANPVTSIPGSLITNTPYQENQANATRLIYFTADADTIMDGPFYFNDSTFDMMRIDYVIPLNSIEVWTLVNKTMVAHPFHLHDEQFYILDRNGIPVGPEERGRKDVVLVAPDDSVRFITMFTDFADTAIPYMFHCHILMHEDDGMMGQFLVVPSAAGIAELQNPNDLLIYPNPASDFVNIVLADNSKTSVAVFNSLGEKVCDVETTANLKLKISNLPSGIYFVKIISNSINCFSKFIKL
jgi:blue copper oxidase